MALQAVEAGAAGLKIVPVGINYESKEEFRSAIWVRVGEPIDVDRFLADHDGNARKARHALTKQLEQDLRELVIHLDDPDWKPYLDDLEVLVPSVGTRAKETIFPLRQRNWLSDSMNHVLGTDRPRAEELGKTLRNYREQVYTERVTVDAPVLQSAGWRDGVDVARPEPVDGVAVCAGVAGNAVPRCSVHRGACGGESDSATGPNNGVAVPVARRFAGVRLVVCGIGLVAVPDVSCVGLVCGHVPDSDAVAGDSQSELLAGDARDRCVVWWHQMRFLFRRERLAELRRQRGELSGKLSALADECHEVSPRPEPPPRISRVLIARRVAVTLGVILVLGVAGWFIPKMLFDRALVTGGYDLKSLSRPRLHAEMERDEKSLRAVVEGLTELEQRAIAVRKEFSAGERSYDNEADNDTVRQMLLSFTNYRAALIRLVWKYLRYDEVEDEKDSLRAFLLDYTAAVVLCESSMKFVHNFTQDEARREKAIKRLNEAEPIWGIKGGLYDTIQKNLASTASKRQLAAAAGVLPTIACGLRQARTRAACGIR